MGCCRAGQRMRRSAHLPPREVGRRWRQRRGHAFFPQLIFECVASSFCALLLARPPAFGTGSRVLRPCRFQDESEVLKFYRL